MVICTQGLVVLRLAVKSGVIGLVCGKESAGTA